MMSEPSTDEHLNSRKSRRGLWISLGLVGITVIALLGALLWRGGASLGFLVAFVVLLPVTLASVLVQWWPIGRKLRETNRKTWWRHATIAMGVSLTVCAALTLVLGVAWSGSRVGNMLLVSGIALLPPAALSGLLATLGSRANELKSLLERNEHTELTVMAHWTVFVLPVLVLSAALILALGPFGTPGLALAAALYLIGLPGTAGQALACYLHSRALLTNRHLYLSYGLLWQKVASLPRDQIKAVGIKRNAWTRLLGQGKLSAVKSDGESIVVAGLRRPGKLARQFES